jgi:hypothetical protein
MLRSVTDVTDVGVVGEEAKRLVGIVMPFQQ